VTPPSRRSGRTPISYRILQLWARTAVSIVYRRVTITDAARLPNDCPVILAANHGNALGDVAVMIAALPEFPSFLAAASWWKSAPARILFDFGGVVPIHRRRDGDTDQNASAFEACNAALAAGAPIAIFPEGEMHLEPSLLPLKTGAARIALGAAAQADLTDLVVAPVGLVYEDRGRLRSDVEIHFGEPIEVVDWLDNYRVDPTKAVRGVTDLLADRLSQVTVNHGSAEEAALVDRAAAYTLADEPGASEGLQFARRNALRRKLASALAPAGADSAAELRALADAVAIHSHDLQQLGTDTVGAPPLDEMSRSERNVLQSQLVALAPAAALGVAVNAPMILGVAVASRRIRSDAWQATTKGVGGTLLSPIVWLLEIAFLARHIGKRRAIALTAAGAACGLASIAWRDRFVRLREATRIQAAEHRDALNTARESRETVRPAEPDRRPKRCTVPGDTDSVPVPCRILPLTPAPPGSVAPDLGSAASACVHCQGEPCTSDSEHSC